MKVLPIGMGPSTFKTPSQTSSYNTTIPNSLSTQPGGVLETPFFPFQPMIRTDFHISWANRWGDSFLCHGSADVGRHRRFFRKSWSSRCRLGPENNPKTILSIININVVSDTNPEIIVRKMSCVSYPVGVRNIT
jgi:hypothetical protein